MGEARTTERVLRLLTLLQHRPSWTASELAGALDVTERCVRRDVTRLRDLGYPVHAAPGTGGGYRLGAGTRLPPLLLDDDEAIATAVSLSLAAGGTVAGAAEAAVRALTKLDQVLPPRLRGQVRAVRESTDTLVGPGVQVDPDALVTLARACRDAVRVRFAYTSAGGAAGERTVEPARLVATGRRWYLLAWDVDRQDWRTFRLDRLSAVEATTWRFTPREHPDPVGHVQRAVSAGPYRHTIVVRLHAPPERVRAMVPPHVGRVDADPRAGWSLLTTGGDDLEALAAHVARLGFDAEVVQPPELRAAAARVAARLTAMAQEPPGGPGDDRPPPRGEQVGT